jgi:Uma2 family endonuclease
MSRITRPIPQTKLVTFEEFCVLVREDQKADLIDGVIQMASPDNTEANDLCVWLLRLLGDFVEIKDLGKVFANRVAFRITQHRAPEPDVAFVRKGRLEVIQRGHVAGAPDLAVEIVSPESVERDYETKRALYEEAGVEEYWILDEVQQEVTWLRLDKSGKYREVRPRKGRLYSEVLPGFWFDPAWLGPEGLPSKIAVLAEILGGDAPAPK